MADIQDDESQPVPVEFNLDEWLDGAQIAQRSIVIYGRPDLVAALEDADRRLTAATSDPEGSLADPEVQRIEAEIEALLAQFEASKSTWYVAGLSPEKATEVQKAWPIPDIPADATDAQRDARAQALAVQNLHWIAAAVVKIVAPAGVKTGVTYEQMEKLRHRLGDRQVAGLKHAAMSAQVEEPQVPVPFSRRRSGPDQT